MQLYKTYKITPRGQFTGFSSDYRRSVAFTTPHDFRRVVEAAIPNDRGLSSVEAYLPDNWARRLARVLFRGARLRAVLRRV